MWVVFALLPDEEKKRKGSLAILKRLFIPASVVGGILLAVSIAAPTNRVNEVVSDYLSGPATLADIGTVSWRLQIYNEAFDRLEGLSKFRLLVGQGTSSGGDVRSALGAEFSAPEEDPNRVFHDEFLRAFYEWGLVGIVCVIAVLWISTKRSWELWRESNSRPAVAHLALIPTILLGLLIENVLSNAGSPGGTGAVLVLACAASADRRIASHFRSNAKSLVQDIAKARLPKMRG